jgi:hypothetical protein
MNLVNVSATNSGALNPVSNVVNNTTRTLRSASNISACHAGVINSVSNADRTQLVAENAYISNLCQQMYPRYDANEVATTLCSSYVLYRNQNYYDWSTNATNVAFIELHGPSVGGLTMECMHCNGLQRKGSVPPSLRHSKDCPFNNFMFEEPVIEDGISIIYFYGKKYKKSSAKCCV